MEKKVKVREEYYIEFTDEELEKLKLKKGDKLSIDIDENTKEIKLIPYGAIDLELSEFNRETLEYLVEQSVIKDVSVNEIINDIVEQAVKNEQ
jgi:bifunctional DNA-binding transcriptional regulator/antitoxin component of YhaV-PrlF toxin-antitoxin module